MRDPRRNPVPARYRYPRKAGPGVAGKRRRWIAIGAGALALAVAAAVGAFLMLRESSPPIDPAERDAAVSFTRALIDVEGKREGVLVEFGQVGIDIRTTEYAIVFRTLQSVIPMQERLAEEIRAIESPSNVTALAHTLFIDSYERELEGYKLLNEVAGQAQATFPGSTARRLRRFDGYDSATAKIRTANRSRERAYEELEDLLGRVGMTLEEVRAANWPLVLSPTPQPSPIPTPTPRPVPTADPSLTIDEIASIMKFANNLMFLEMRQRNIVRDYRIYNIEFLTRWIGESYSGAEALLESQRRLLNDVRKVEAPDIEGAAVSLSLYVDSMEEGVEAFERLLAALGPLNEAGVSVVGGIRMGMLPNIGINEGLSRSAMTRRDARERLEALVNRAGLVLGDVESTRRGASEDL